MIILFKQKTAYEMLISDWSSDVCSSDLLSPWELLAVLHEVEAEHERVRSVPNASRTLDLDLLAYDDRVVDGAGGLMLPHPRLSERAFVLQPLVELAPEWRHPGSGLTAAEMLAELPPGQQVEPPGLPCRWPTSGVATRGPHEGC